MRMAKGNMMKVILDVTCIYHLPEDQKQLDNDRKYNKGWSEEEQDGYVKRNHVIVSEED